MGSPSISSNRPTPQSSAPSRGAQDAPKATDRVEARGPEPRDDAPPARTGFTDDSDYQTRESPASEVAGAIAGTPAVHTRTEGIARHESARLAESIQGQIDAGTLSKNKAGPVGAVVVDNTTRKTYTGRNTGVPDNLHPVLERRLQSMDPSRMHNSRAGGHAEINALNDALWAREARNRTNGRGPVTDADLSSMTLDTVWTKTNQRGGMVQGQSAPRCANCTQLTDGVHNLAGDATQPYSPDKAATAGVDPADAPRGRYRQQNGQSLRRGAVIGGLAGAGASTVRALADGHLSGAEAAGIAVDAGLGVATGAAGDVVEHGVARTADRAAGQALQRSAGATTRVAAGRLAGAGVAGAVIGAGFSSVDQIQAYQRGEVTASEAIGTVTAEAATGLAAGAAGAAAGAAVGSVIPIAGTAVGAVVGFGVGMAAGYLADRGLRATGVTDAIADGVTSAIDAGASVVNDIGETVGGWGRSLASAFGW